MTSISRLSATELTDLDLSAHVELPVEQLSAHDTNIVSLRRAKNKAILINGFDYTGVPKAVIKEAEATAMRIRDRNRAHSIDTGNELLNIKQKLEHGKFGRWLKFHFGWKERTAQNYMNSATAFGSTPQVIDILPLSTVYKLAATSTPDALRQSVIEEINKGGTPDPKKIEKRIAESKTEARQKGNSDDNVQQDNAATLPESSKPGVVQAQDKMHELRAKKIAEHLKKCFGVNFDVLRGEILKTDLVALRKALCEA